MLNALINKLRLNSALVEQKTVGLTYKSKQRGVILLLSLVLLLVLTVTTASMVRSALVGVNTTAALQRNTIVHHALSSVILKEIDYLHKLEEEQHTAFMLKIGAVINGGTTTISGDKSFEDTLGVSASEFKKSTGIEIVSISSVLASRKHLAAGETSPVTPMDNVVPKLERSMCVDTSGTASEGGGGKVASKPCYNFIIMTTAVVANLRGNGTYKIEQIAGFGKRTL